MMDFFRLIISSLEPSQNLKSGFGKNITGFEKSAVNLDQGCPESGRSNAIELQSTSMGEGDAPRSDCSRYSNELTKIFNNISANKSFS